MYAIALIFATNAALAQSFPGKVADEGKTYAEAVAICQKLGARVPTELEWAAIAATKGAQLFPVQSGGPAGNEFRSPIYGADMKTVVAYYSADLYLNPQTDLLAQAIAKQTFWGYSSPEATSAPTFFDGYITHRTKTIGAQQRAAVAGVYCIP